MSITTIQILQLVVAGLLIAAILIQRRGSGLGEVFGGGGAVYRTKRGAEKMIVRGTVVLIVLMVLLALAAIFIENK